MRLSRGASLDERRQCSDPARPPNALEEKHSCKIDNVTNNSADRHSKHENSISEPKKKSHSSDRREKSKSDRRSFYSERENSGQMLKVAAAVDFSADKKCDSHIKKGDIFVNEENSVGERLAFYNEADSHPKKAATFVEHESNLAPVRDDGAFFSTENELQAENRIRRDAAKSKFFENELANSVNSEGRNLYSDLEEDSQIRHSDSRCNIFEKNGTQLKVDNEPNLQSRRTTHFAEFDNRKSFGEVEMRRNKSSTLRQELHSQRSAFSESIDSASSRSYEPTTDFAEKMMKSSRNYLAESDCCRLNMPSSARETSDDSSPGAITQGGFETLDSKYARKRARKCGHRRQKSLDISRHTTQESGEAKSFRDFDLEEDLSKRLDRLEPKTGGFIRQSLNKNHSRYDLNFDSEDDRCFRLSLDMERSFDLDFLDTSIDDRYGSFDRDFDLV